MIFIYLCCLKYCEIKKHILKKNILILVCLFYCISSFGQCFDKNFAFKEGEILRYEAYYNWGFIWLNAGFVEFKVEQSSYLTRPVYHFNAIGETHKSYEWIYKVHDHFESYLDKQTLLPLWFNQETYEGDYQSKNRYWYDYDNQKAYLNTQNSHQAYKRDTLNLPPCTFDLISLVYYCRNLNFSKLAVGDSIPIKSIVDDEFFNLYIRYLGKEKIKSKDEKEYNCVKFSALLIEGTMFKGGEDMFVWVTDDLNRIPILVEAKILIGSVKAYYDSGEGLRNPVQAGIK
jgi:hypothetical protein